MCRSFWTIWRGFQRIEPLRLSAESDVTQGALDRRTIFPEPELPRGGDLVAEGRAAATSVQVGASPFLKHYDIASEAEYKRQRASEGQIMFQIGRAHV